MEMTIEQIVQKVTQEVLRQLARQGVSLPAGNTNSAGGLPGMQAQRIDMSKYRTPLVMEQDLLGLHELTREILVPQGTILTPRAKELIRKKNVRIQYEN